MSLICKLRIQNVQTFQVIFCFFLYFSEPMADDFLNIRQVMTISAARAAQWIEYTVGGVEHLHDPLVDVVPG